jgi:hypothetical protein
VALWNVERSSEKQQSPDHINVLAIVLFIVDNKQIINTKTVDATIPLESE